MRHAVLGVGGIGGLVGGALARAGEDVVLLLRPARLAEFEGRLRIESVVLGTFDVAVAAQSALGNRVDVVWVATKATQLEDALSLAPAERVGDATVVPLLNGVDHVTSLRRRYGHVVAAAIRVESERAGPWSIRQSSPFLRVEMAGAPPAQEALRRAGIECHAREDEITLLWDKLVFLAPVALATSAFDGTLGDVRGRPLFAGCREEAIAAARAEGALVDEETVRSLHEGAPAAMRSSMQKDVDAGREPEIDAIAGPIIRQRFSTPATRSLVEMIQARS